MANKSKRPATLFLLLGILVIVIVAYVIVTPLMNKTEEVEETEEESIMIAEFDDDDLVSIEFTYDGETLKFNYKSKTYTWVLDGDDDFSVDQEKLAYMANCITNLPASRVLEEGEISLEDAGLDEPQLDVTADYGDYSYTYHLGDYNSFSQLYYFNVDNDSNVYMIPSGMLSYFSYTKLDLLSQDEIPTLSASTVKSYTLTKPDGEVVTYDSETNRGYLSSVYIASTEAYKPDDETLTYYLLDDTNASLLTIPYTVTTTVQDDDSSVAAASVSKDYTLTIRIGGLCDDDDSKRYVMINDSPVVYRMSTSILESVMTVVEDEAEETVT